MEVVLAGIEPSRIAGYAELVGALSEEQSVAAFVAQLQAELGRRGLMAGALVLDGQGFSPQRNRLEAARPLETFARLEVEVLEARAELGAVFAGCIEALAKLLDFKDAIAQYVRLGSVTQALENLAVFCRELGFILAAHRSGLSLLQTTGLGRTADIALSHERLDGLDDALRDIRDGVRRRDLVLISDALDYELPGGLHALREDFSSWTRRLAAPDC